MRKFMYVFVVGLMLALVMYNHNRSTTETASTLDTMYVSTSLVPTTVSTVAPTTTTEIPATTTTVAPTTTTTAKPKPVVTTTTTVVVTAAPQASTGVNAFLECVKHRESRGDYTAVNASSGSAGAYQFVQNTWNATANHIGRPDLVGLNPAAASPATQDMMAMALYAWQGASPWAYPAAPC